MLSHTVVTADTSQRQIYMSAEVTAPDMHEFPTCLIVLIISAYSVLAGVFFDVVGAVVGERRKSVFELNTVRWNWNKIITS